uniref:GPI mannosyltransferase 2 n=1 Tax=Trypanosoma congolense (strain IL3000) TaxID=1068625 RepID=G0UY78_TRYCI|nr:conserved hypothetical protein [Trypanosoma congolense IL3000]
MPYLALNYFCYTRFVPLWDESARTEINGRFWAFYSWIQRRYWDVGFLQSYRWGNTHNVIISAPIVYFTVRGFVLFILNPTLARRSTAETAHVQQRAGCRNASQKSASGGARRMAFSLYAVVEDLVQSPSVICLMATLILGATMAHVNVVNRLVMSSPALYWLWGRQFVWDPWGGNTIVMLRVFVLWNCIGALFIPNGLPWT